MDMESSKDSKRITKSTLLWLDGCTGSVPNTRPFTKRGFELCSRCFWREANRGSPAHLFIFFRVNTHGGHGSCSLMCFRCDGCIQKHWKRLYITGTDKEWRRISKKFGTLSLFAFFGHYRRKETIGVLKQILTNTKTSQVLLSSKRLRALVPLLAH